MPRNKKFLGFFFKKGKMRDPKRIDRILELLKNVWHKHPDMRLGQLIENCVDGTTATFYTEDEVIEENLKKLNKK
jgi:uncharacterized protein YihD (DUF1040 family)